MNLTLDEFRLALGEDGRRLPDAELRKAHLESEILARVLFDHLAPRRSEKNEERAA